MLLALLYKLLCRVVTVFIALEYIDIYNSRYFWYFLEQIFIPIYRQIYFSD